MKRWDFNTNEYRDYFPAHADKCKTYSPEIEDVIVCADCGKEITYGDSYTSSTIHDDFGFGYCVCVDCMKKEWEARKKAEGDLR